MAGNASRGRFNLLATAQAQAPVAPIEHVFVLMLENRSFDHFFGLSGIHGTPRPPSASGFGPGATDRLLADPKHEYQDVKDQMNQGAMDGFGKPGDDAMLGFEPPRVPVLSALAREAILMDNWFSSMPGPTWPNRFFVHAASSGGLDNSPSGPDVVAAVNSPLLSYRFDGGHIFDRLVREGRSWRVYHDDAFPQVLALRGMVEKRFNPTFFRPLADLAGDVAGPYDASYTFIEPSYDPFGNYANGNSQHPLGCVAAGEALVKHVYEAIFSCETGGKSVLIVVWDEHGGFFDHVKPPKPAVPPGDTPWNQDRAAPHPGERCKFDQFGVRVPALIVSPWLPKGLGSHVFPDQVFDHASIVSSLRMAFGLGEPLTARDAAAPSWYTELLPQPRPLPTQLPAAPEPTAPVVAPHEVPASPSLLGTFQNAVKFDWELSSRVGRPPLISSVFKEKLDTVNTEIGEGADGTLTNEQREAIVSYLAALSQRETALDHEA